MVVREWQMMVSLKWLTFFLFGVDMSFFLFLTMVKCFSSVSFLSLATIVLFL